MMQRPHAQDATLLRSSSSAYENHAFFKFSVLLPQGTSWVLEYAPQH